MSVLGGLRGVIVPDHVIATATIMEDPTQIDPWASDSFLKKKAIICDATVHGIYIPSIGETTHITLFDGTVDMVGDGIVLTAQQYTSQAGQIYTQVRIRLDDLQPVQKIKQAAKVNVSAPANVSIPKPFILNIPKPQPPPDPTMPNLQLPPPNFGEPERKIIL